MMQNKSEFLIQPFEYISQPICSSEHYIYIVNRAGCLVVEEGFEIIRDDTYEYCVFHYVYQGTGLLIVGNKEYQLKKGDVFILGIRESHMYVGNDDNRLGLIWVEFYGSNSAQLINMLRSKNIRMVHTPDSKIILEELLELTNYITQTQEIDVFKNTILLYKLICSTLKVGMHQKQTAMIYPPHIQRSMDYIKRNFQKNITVTELANLVNCSLSYFSKSFSKTIGVTPTQYMMMMKIEAATRLMAISDPTCEEIADELGFYDATHFVKMYKKYTGRTPKQFNHV